MSDVEPVKLVEVLVNTESMQGVIKEMMGHIKCVGTNTLTADSSVRTTDLSDYLKRLRLLYPQLAVKLSAKPVAAVLFQNKVLTWAQLQQVQLSQTPVAAAEYLLNQLLNTPSEASFEYFRRALQSTNQEHIYLWLSHDDYDIDSQVNDLIRQNYTFLLYNLNSKDTGLIAQLFQNEVIDQPEKESVESCKGAVDQAEILLSVLSRKSAEQFKQFLTALDQTGQRHIACKLRGQPYDVSSGADDSTLNVCDDSPTSNASTSPTSNTCTSPTSNASTITCVIGASEDRKGKVSGLTVHGDELFIVRFKFKGLIEVYNVTDFTFKRNAEVPEGEGLCNGLTSCNSNKCLFVSSYVYSHGAGYIAKVELTGNNEVIKWKVKDDFKPHGLSVNCEHNLLVACSRRRPPNALFEYKPDGELVHRILLQDDVVDPHHAVQLKSNQFVVSHGFGDDSLHRLCVVDANGLVLHSYGNKPGSKTGRLNKPRYLAVDRGGFIFVADCGNDRIVVLDSKLKWSRYLQSADDGVIGGVTLPYSLYLDDQRGKLIVGEENGDDSRVVVVNTKH